KPRPGTTRGAFLDERVGGDRMACPVENDRPRHGAEVRERALRMTREKVERDLGLDEPGAREPRLEVEKRGAVGETQERAAEPDGEHAVRPRTQGEYPSGSRRLQADPLTGEEHEPAIGREEEQPATATAIETDEPA